MRNNMKRNTRIKLIALFTAIVLWMYVMAVVDPEDTKLFENVPVTVTNTDELQGDDLVVYPQSDLVTDIYITGKLSDLQKISEEDIARAQNVPTEEQAYQAGLNNEEIPEENFTSNSLDPGTELFANETDDTKIYAKLEEKYYLLYEQVIEEDADS